MLKNQQKTTGIVVNREVNVAKLIKPITNIMQESFEILPADRIERVQVTRLLMEEKLAVEDLPSSLSNFVVSGDNGEITGIAGFEVYSPYGLLRSVAVKPSHRNKNIAGALVHSIEAAAKAKGLTEMYLLTETASGYFAKKGYGAVSREEVPEAIKQSSEFSHVCPVSAVVMKKALL